MQLLTGGCLLVSLGLTAPIATAQVLTVDPGGAAQYTDLQTAIDAAPGGAVILVNGGVWQTLAISRSLTIVGTTEIEVRPDEGFSTGQQPPAIELQGSGSEQFTLVNATVQGDVPSPSYSCAAPGIESSGFAQIRVFDARIAGTRWTAPTGRALGVPGIRAAGAVLVHVERAVIEASATFGDDSMALAPNGAAGIEAPGAIVAVMQSRVLGGDVWQPDLLINPGPVPCPCPAGPNGAALAGDGVLASTLYESGSLIEGGAPTAITVLGQPYGQQPGGVATSASSTIELPFVMTLGVPLRLGATGFVLMAPPQGPSVLVVGLPESTPINTPIVSYVFVDLLPPAVTRLIGPTTTLHATSVPFNFNFAGFELAYQRFDLVNGSVVASNPVHAVVRR